MVSVTTLGQATDQIDRLRILQTDLATLQRQLASGKKANTFDGLGIDAIQSLRGRADFSEIDSYLANIKTANRRMNLMTSSLTKIQEQTENFQNAFAIQTSEGNIDLSSISRISENTRTFMEDLVNVRDGERYLFGGADTQNPPLQDNGSLNSYAASRVQDWIDGTLTTDEFIESYTDRDALTDTIVGYSTVISSGEQQSITVRVQQSTEIDYTVEGNNSAFRDIMVTTAILNEMDAALDKVALEDGDNPSTTTVAPGADASEQNDNFFRVYNDLSNKLNTALDGINGHIFTISNAQAQAQQVGETHKVQQNVVLDQITDVENVDINEVAVKINSLSIQLQASYSVTAAISQLSLVNFL